MGVIKEKIELDLSGSETTLEFSEDYSGHQVTIQMENKDLDAGDMVVQVDKKLDNSKRFVPDLDQILSPVPQADDDNIFETEGKGYSKYRLSVTKNAVTAGKLICNVTGIN